MLRIKKRKLFHLFKMNRNFIHCGCERAVRMQIAELDSMSQPSFFFRWPNQAITCVSKSQKKFALFYSDHKGEWNEFPQEIWFLHYPSKFRHCTYIAPPLSNVLRSFLKLNWILSRNSFQRNNSLHLKLYLIVQPKSSSSLFSSHLQFFLVFYDLTLMSARSHKARAMLIITNWITECSLTVIYFFFKK